MALQSYKPYARIVTIISSLIIIIAGLDATQVINLFPEYASQINSILVLCGLLAPAISQELRVVRAEDLVKEDLGTEGTNGTNGTDGTEGIDGDDVNLDDGDDDVTVVSDEDVIDDAPSYEGYEEDVA